MVGHPDIDPRFDQSWLVAQRFRMLSFIWPYNARSALLPERSRRLVKRKRSRPTVQKVDLPSHNGEIIRSGRPQIGFSDNYFSSLRLFLMLVGFRKSLPQSQRRNG